MRNTLLAVAVIALSGCSAAGSSNSLSWLAPDNPARYGYRSYDPCIRCGEGWIFLNIDETQSLKERTHAGQN